jgi:hypothetical protein
MIDHKQNLTNSNRNQSQDKSAKSESHLKNLTHQISTKGNTSGSVAKVTEEAVDVLSLMGFKL